MNLEMILVREEKTYRRRREMKRELIIPDIHAPYEDYRALNAIYAMARKEKFDNIRVLGDIVDFYALSSFDKNPDRITGLQQEIDIARYHLEEMKKLTSGDVILYEGNHEYRLKKYLMKNPELSSLRSINNVPAMLGLDELGVKYMKNQQVKGVIFKHGNLVRKHSCYTAKGEFENEGTSGVSGHTHRLGSFYNTNRSGSHGWFEMGHLCDEDLAEYMEGKVPNWQKGFGVFSYDEKSNFWKIEQIPIINNSFLYKDKLYKWNSNAKVEKRQNLGLG